MISLEWFNRLSFSHKTAAGHSTHAVRSFLFWECWRFSFQTCKSQNSSMWFNRNTFFKNIMWIFRIVYGLYINGKSPLMPVESQLNWVLYWGLCIVKGKYAYCAWSHVINMLPTARSGLQSHDSRENIRRHCASDIIPGSFLLWWLVDLFCVHPKGWQGTAEALATSHTFHLVTLGKDPGAQSLCFLDNRAATPVCNDLIGR